MGVDKQPLLDVLWCALNIRFQVSCYGAKIWYKNVLLKRYLVQLIQQSHHC